MQLELVCDKRNKFGIGRLTFCIADRVPKETLKGIQIPSVPGDFDGMADGPLYSAGGGLEGLCHLGVEYLGDGIGGLSARPRGFWVQPDNPTNTGAGC